jgi:hypothetical protein
VNKPRPACKVGDALDTERLEGSRGRPLQKAAEGGRATQGKEVHQHPRQERGRRSDVGAVLALVGAP